jgi:hypothetical protein
MTGPIGQGPMTGRGLGRCSGSAGPGFGFGPGRWFGRGSGFGRRFGPGRWLSRGGAFVPRVEVRQDLEAYRDELKRELAGVEEELGRAEPGAK